MFKKILLAIGLLSGIALNAQNLSFSDTKLFNALIAQKVDVNGDGQISQTEANAKVKLVLDNYQITSLDDLVPFANLKSLSVRKNNLTQINPILLGQLRMLNAAVNKISQFPVLTTLNIDTIIIDTNAITAISAINFPNLKYLSVRNNPFSVINLSGLSQLKHLRVDRTLIKKLDFTGLGNLSTISGDGNSLDSLIAHSDYKFNLDHLWNLGARYLDFSQNTQLETIFISWYSKKIIKLNLNYCSNLKSVKIVTSTFDTLSLENLTSLKELSVTSSPGNNSQLINILKIKNLTALEKFDVLTLHGNNLLQNYMQNMPMVETLSVGKIMDTDLSFLINYPQLKSLTIRTQNSVNSVSLNNHPNLLYLNLNHSKNLYVENCPKLQSLNLGDITNSWPALLASDSLYLKNCPELIEVNFVAKKVGIYDCNKLTTFKINALENITISNCTAFSTFPQGWWNPDFSSTIKKVKINNCPSLLSLTISWYSSKLNQLELINCNNLKSLSVSGNKLTNLDLSGVPKLERLNCNDNLLANIDVSVVPLLRLLNCNTNKDMEYLDLTHANVIDTLNVATTKPYFFVCVADTNNINIRSVNPDVPFSELFFQCDKINFPDANLKAALLSYQPAIDTDKNNEISHFEALKFSKLLIESNNIGIVKGLQYFRKLDSLTINYNNISFIDVSSYSYLTYLNLNNNILNQIQIFPPKDEENPQLLSSESNTTLKTMLLNGNNLSVLDVSNIDNLNTLDVRNNSQLSTVCVSSNQLITKTLTWSKDVATVWSTGSCSVITSTNNKAIAFTTIYPNPANEVLFLETSDYLGASVQILDATGKVLMTQSLTSEKSSINTYPLSPGVYFVQVRSKIGNSSLKLIKN